MTSYYVFLINFMKSQLMQIKEHHNMIRLLHTYSMLLIVYKMGNIVPWCRWLVQTWNYHFGFFVCSKVKCEPYTKRKYTFGQGFFHRYKHRVIGQESWVENEWETTPSVNFELTCVYCCENHCIFIIKHNWPNTTMVKLAHFILRKYIWLERWLLVELLRPPYWLNLAFFSRSIKFGGTIHMTLLTNIGYGYTLAAPCG